MQAAPSDTSYGREGHMAEEAEEQVKKKGKLPVLIVVAVVLFGGGFFGLKMKGGNKEEPEIKLGKIVEFDEKLFNLSDMQSYLRTTVALHMKDGYDEAKLKEVLPAVEDALNLVIRSKSPNQVQTIAGIMLLKKDIAAKINSVLDSLDGKKEDEAEEKAAKPAADKKPEKGADKKPEMGDDKKPEKGAVKKPEPPDNDWDSQTGPVLKVYFKAFAVQ